VRILVVNAHPDEGSLCEALARAYVAGARECAHEIHVTNVRELRFDPILRGGSTQPQPLEEDLEHQRWLIRWCQHFVIVTPNWHSGLPALFKGYVDRVFAPGFGAVYLDHFPYVEPLLRGRSARVIYTQNAPLWLGRLARGDLVGDYVWRVTKRAILGHSGFKPVRKSGFGNVRRSTARTRAGWLQQVEALGRRAM
jgi:putative NADPH-quinone reductase